ncbi:MAG: YqgE/AlgH family protein [Rhodothermales bacterium]
MSTDLSLQPGRLLIAPPVVQDPNFKRSVVLLCEHTPDGSFGLILNRPMGIRLAEVIELIGNREYALLQGGPVQTDTMHFLHTYGDDIPGHIPVREDVFWGGDFEIMKALIETGEISQRDVRFYLGYAGWGAGQLEHEAEEGGWIVADGDGRFVFDAEPERLWRTILRELGGEYAVLANFPEDPRLN